MEGEGAENTGLRVTGLGWGVWFQTNLFVLITKRKKLPCAHCPASPTANLWLNFGHGSPRASIFPDYWCLTNHSKIQWLNKSKS